MKEKSIMFNRGFPRVLDAYLEIKKTYFWSGFTQLSFKIIPFIKRCTNVG